MARYERVNSGAPGLAGSGSAVALVSAATLVMTFLSIALLVSCAPKPENLALIPGNYNTWGRTTDLRLDYPIPGHEDNFRVIYMNDLGFGFSRTADGQAEQVIFPEGTVIAKAIFDGSAPGPDASPMMVTAMVKAADNPDARGGWVWVVKDLALGKETVMEGDFCITCHTNANEAHPYGDKNLDEGFCDYVFFIPGAGY